MEMVARILLLQLESDMDGWVYHYPDIRDQYT